MTIPELYRRIASVTAYAQFTCPITDADCTQLSDLVVEAVGPGCTAQVAGADARAHAVVSWQGRIIYARTFLAVAVAE